MAKLNGAQIMARSLKQQGVDYMFGIVGFPVQNIAAEAQKAGIKFIGMRNEQAASYAAQIDADVTALVLGNAQHSALASLGAWDSSTTRAVSRKPIAPRSTPCCFSSRAASILGINSEMNSGERRMIFVDVRIAFFLM